MNFFKKLFSRKQPVVVPKYPVTVVEGIQLVNVHPEEVCRGRACVVHNPLNHHMRDWRLIWRNDRGIFERLCPTHGCGHPDPSQGDYWRETNQDWQGLHGCCGCCRIPTSFSEEWPR